jgi:indolepyruvate ferredoxin oxidoreductase beta subunit
MGASVGMARGAAEAGIPYAAAVIGDSTFLHSGITGLLDAISSNTPMTLIILDNSIVAMTGCQETIIPSAKLRGLILGLGVAPEHLVELEAKKQFVEENAALLKKEMEYRGVSVVIFRRECLEAARKRRGNGAETAEKGERHSTCGSSSLASTAKTGYHYANMKKDIILAGVGGQGVLSIAAIIAQAAVREGLNVRQSEVHGMAQRGGAVLAHLRISNAAIASDLVPRGRADLIISMEVLESLRYAAWLAPSGALVSAAEPFVNINDYPDIESVSNAVKSFPLYRLIEASALAREAGAARSVNMVMVGAASPFLPLKPETLEDAIISMFASKDDVAEANRKAFNLGRAASK